MEFFIQLTLHIVEHKLLDWLPVFWKILNYSFCTMESLHCNFHDMENLNCTYHIVDNITRCFPHSGNSPRWALKGPFGGHECPRGCPGLYYYRTKISKKVLPIVENVLWKKDVHRSCKKWENYKVQLKGPVWYIHEPRLDFDPIGVGSCPLSQLVWFFGA